MNIKYSKLLLISLGAMALAACSSSSSDSDDSGKTENDSTATTVNYGQESNTTAASNDYVYYKISDGKLVKTDIKQADAAKSDAWDVGFYRTKVFINSGDSGKGTVVAALAAAQNQFYDDKGAANMSVFTNASTEQEGKTAWQGVSDLAAVKQLEFKEPKDAAVIGTSWFNYDMESHKVSVNANGGYLLRSSTGDSYAKMRVTDMKSAGINITGLTIEFAVQAKGTSLYGAPSSKEYDLSQNKCIDFDTQAVVACTADTGWDLQLDGYTLWLNSDVKGGGKGALGMTSKPWNVTGEGWTMFKGGTEKPLASHYITDAPAGTFEAYPWYKYSEDHKIWPNYRVYVLRTGKAEPFKYYKFQLVSYYGGKDGAYQHVISKLEELK